ncbi:MAG: hypothetical protein EBR95_00865 [Verrucomicrobia bacterium]|nr:hypothetical protein [Verrucomicrobiota bacterium]
MRTTLRTSLFVLVAFLFGCSEPKQEVVQAEAYLEAIRNAGLVTDGLKSVEIGEVRRIRPEPTRWQRQGRPFWWAELRCSEGSAGYLAWTDDGRLIDFSVEGLRDVATPEAFALAGVPPIQQFPIKSGDGALVASGCVPTAGASLIAFWTVRPTMAAWGREGEQASVRRLRSRLRMAVIPDEEGYTDGTMSLAGAFPEQLAEALQADADEQGVDVDVAISGYDRRLLGAELSAGRPVLVSCTVLVPRKPQLSWGHQLVAVGRAEVGGAHYIGVIDNFYVPRLAGTVRWIAEDRVNLLVLVRPRR